MSLNPLNELKRRLDDDDIPLPKRLCLAKNIVQSHHFPTAPKERVVAEWLEGIMCKNKLSTEELRSTLDWLNIVDDLTNELKSKLIQVVSQYVQRNTLHKNEMEYILSFLENGKISSQMSQHIDEYLRITVTLLQCLKSDELTNIALCQKILNNLIKYYKESKKKLELIIKILDGDKLETVFSFLDTDCRESVIELCRNVLFPINKKSYFISFLQTLIRKDNIDELIAEKGDNIQSVIKIMSVLFEYPKQRTEKDPKFLKDFIDVFVSCFCSESQVVFAFYIMIANVLNMNQSYITPSMNMTPIIFDENNDKIKRNLFLSMLEIILRNEVDVSVRLTDTFGEKISKVEIKKNFMSFLQAVMMGQLKLEGKPDKTTLQIIKTALKLDPILIEEKIEKILPPIMTMKKHSANVMESYTEMLNCLIEILFKLSRGTVFINQILPFVKLNLEACNTEQFELKQKVKECIKDNKDCEKLNSKIITGHDIFPQECAELFGKLTSDLMFRQNKELLELLHKDFEEHCLMMLEEGFVSPSIITLAEVLSAILSSFLRHNKMADHTVPQHVAKDFWNMYKTFEEECLKKFGQCILKLSHNPLLILAFLKLCLSFSQLKLLNVKYSNVKLDILEVNITSEVFDLTPLLPCLTKEQWIALASSVQNDEAVLILDNLILLKAMALELTPRDNEEIPNELSPTKTHLIKQLNTNQNILASNNYFPRILFTNLDNTQYKQLSKNLVKLYVNNQETDIFKNVATTNNRPLLNCLVLETSKNITKCLENCDLLTKALNKTDFNMAAFAKENDMKEYFNRITLKEENQDEAIRIFLDIIKQLQISYLEENYQVTAIFVLLALKKCCQTKKIRRNIDYVLQAVYELSPQHPDLYQIFPVEFIFSFEDKTMIDLLTLTIKTSNKFLVIKSILESAVRRVRTESNLVKNIVGILLSKTSCKSGTLVESFSEPAFQISCIILPLIVKQKKAITASAFRSILADLQEKLHRSLLESFKNHEFGSKNSNLFITTDNVDDSVVDSDCNVATLNAMAAYSLTLSRYCETTDVEEIKNLDCLWSGMEFFVQNADLNLPPSEKIKCHSSILQINSIQNPDSKHQHIETSTQLLNVTLRHIKKIESHAIFDEKDKLFTQIWHSIKARSLLVHEQTDNVICHSYLEDIAVTLKYICELTSVECFVTNFVGDLTNLTGITKPSLILKDKSKPELTSHKVSKYLWGQCLKANIVGPKCVAMSKSMYQTCRNLRLWIRQHYESERDSVANRKRKKINIYSNDGNENVKIVIVEDVICNILKVDLDMLSEVIFAGKKISLDYKFLDCIFELQHMVHYILGCNTSQLRCQISWQAFFTLFEGCTAVLNSLIISREEILEDRWPCYMQCYRALVTSLCERSASHAQLVKAVEERLAEIAHSIEKLTQSICKRKKHVSRIAAYSVADICTSLERTAPSRMVRQHLENSVALLIQASDSTYAIAFLKRALAGSTGQMTLTNLYTMYKRYHKYVGNS